MKELVSTIDATPSKRLYLSIIADYGPNQAISELVDNALDIWTLGGRHGNLKIVISIDKNQQRIKVQDNAGGIGSSDLTYIVAPGHSKNSEIDQTIGIFGVGSKRAVVALAQDVKIVTRRENETFLVEFDDSWIENSESWNLQVFKVADIERGTTEIELIRLRRTVDDEMIERLRDHLSSTYAIFLKDSRLTILLNQAPISPHSYENWAYPPEFEPRIYLGKIPTESGVSVDALVTAGLALESSQATGEYGVYFYCNDRLIAKGLKTFDVGFTAGIAGKPHADISLARIIVNLHGPARLMPWNSSKADINPSHEVFQAMRKWLLTVVKDYTSLSRRLSKMEGGWPTNVFEYDEGNLVEVEIPDIPMAATSYLPPLPESKPRYGNQIQKANKAIGTLKPWTTGLYESIIAADWVLKANLQQKNRVALLILDSTLEIGFKEYLVNDSGKYFSDQQLSKIFAQRHLVHAEIQQCLKISQDIWKKISHYYDIRCQLVHRRASITLGDQEMEDFRKVVETVLTKLFKLQFKK